MTAIGGKKYYTLEEAAVLAGVSLRTLRRWISSGRLSDFLYPFRASPSELLYRLEPPEDGEMQNPKGEWILRKGGAGVEGISSS